MRQMILRTALVAGAALAVSACGGADKAANTANEVDANSAMEPLNDQSALESANNVVEPLPAPETNTGDDVLGETDGGDTGGETIETNTPGM